MARDRILQIYRGTTAQNDAFTGAQGELTMDTARKEIRIHDGSTAGGNVVGLTPGFIAPFAGSTAPAGWLVCDGSAVSRTTYAKLFAVIGTTYGEGDGNSTFNLPNTPTQKIITGNTLSVVGNGAVFGLANNGSTGAAYAALYKDTNNSAMRARVYPDGTGIGAYVDKFYITKEADKSGMISDTSGLPAYALIIKY